MLKRTSSVGSVYSASKRSKPNVASTSTMRRIANAAVLRSQEIKSSNAANSTGGGSGGAVTLFSVIAQGVNDGERIGDTITVKEIKYRSLVSSSVAATQGDIFRTLLVYDMQSNGASPTIDKILNLNGSVYVTADYNTTYIPAKGGSGRPRFKILYDKVFTMDHYTATTGNNDMRYNLVHLKNLNLKINYLGTGATVASIASGAIYEVVVAYNNTNLTASVGNMSINYIDA